jgi:hypothetical protein
MVAEVSVHHGRESVQPSSSHHGDQETDRKRECLHLLSFSFSPCYSIWTPILWDYTIHFQGRSPFPLVNPFWKHGHRHTKECALLMSYYFSFQSKLTIMYDHRVLFHFSLCFSRCQTFYKLERRG